MMVVLVVVVVADWVWTWYQEEHAQKLRDDPKTSCSVPDIVARFGPDPTKSGAKGGGRMGR